MKPKRLKPLPLYKTSPKKLSTVFLRAARLVKRGWCQGDAAVDAHGKSVETTDPSAERVCFLGAVTRATNGSLPCVDPYSNVWSLLYGCKGVTFNDNPSTTQKMVVDKLLELAHSCKHE